MLLAHVAHKQTWRALAQKRGMASSALSLCPRCGQACGTSECRVGGASHGSLYRSASLSFKFRQQSYVKPVETAMPTLPYPTPTLPYPTLAPRALPYHSALVVVKHVTQANVA